MIRKEKRSVPNCSTVWNLFRKPPCAHSSASSTCSFAPKTRMWELFKATEFMPNTNRLCEVHGEPLSLTFNSRASGVWGGGDWHVAHSCCSEQVTDTETAWRTELVWTVNSYFGNVSSQEDFFFPPLEGYVWALLHLRYKSNPVLLLFRHGRLVSACSCSLSCRGWEMGEITECKCLSHPFLQSTIQRVHVHQISRHLRQCLEMDISTKREVKEGFTVGKKCTRDGRLFPITA